MLNAKNLSIASLFIRVLEFLVFFKVYFLFFQTVVIFVVVVFLSVFYYTPQSERENLIAHQALRGENAERS